MQVNQTTIRTAIRQQETALGIADRAAESVQSQYDQLLARVAKKPESDKVRANVDNILAVAAMEYENIAREARSDQELAMQLKGFDAAKPEKWRNARLSNMRQQLIRAVAANELTRKPSPKQRTKDGVVLDYSIEWSPVTEAEEDTALDHFNDCVKEYRKAYKAGGLKAYAEATEAMQAAIQALHDKMSPSARKAAKVIAEDEIDASFDDEGAEYDAEGEDEVIANLG